MTEAEAIAAAERVLALINSTPRTPPKEVIAAAIGFTRTVDVTELCGSALLADALKEWQARCERRVIERQREIDRKSWFDI